jgi:hypothetical protein
LILPWPEPTCDAPVSSVRLGWLSALLSVVAIVVSVVVAWLFAG